MALVPCQVLRVAILLSYFSILCTYKAIDMPAHQTYGGSWKFLTFINLVIQAVFFGICVLTDLSSLLTKGSDSQEQERQLKKLISLRDWMMAVLAFPVGVFVVTMFWSLYIYDREVVYPKVLDNFIPAWLNHGMLHHRKDRRAPARCQWPRTAHRGHHSRLAPRRRTSQPHGGDDGGPSTTTRRRRTPSCWPSIVGSWRSPSSGCVWRSAASSCRSGRWPGTRRHGGPLCGHSTVSPTTWPPMPRRPLLRPPCLLHRLHHLLRHPPSHCHPPPRALPLRGTWGQLTPAGHIYRSARPPASPGQG
ncbi:androgen-induced gene 1 protein isoform X1 [Carettochelys insculpta]|uniref:androgen-induced gene 1 protein isoform X1 n=1 Tax=Carettochelys insculpta TaxID=44489 RepID=UPI003EB9671C